MFSNNRNKIIMFTIEFSVIQRRIISRIISKSEKVIILLIYNEKEKKEKNLKIKY